VHDGIILARGAIFEIRQIGEIVQCEVVNRSDVSGEEGARCAAMMHDVLTTRVLTAQSQYRGLLFDVRQGPPAFGPKTRATLELVFAAAAASQRRVSVLVGGSATQRMQFGNLCQEHAPELARVFLSESQAKEWLTSASE
jgi:hypothetical protein